MKVLVISNNYIVIKDGKCWCDPNFYYILKRFSYLGEISLASIARDDAPTYVELDFVPKERVHFIKKTRVLPAPVNTPILEKAVKDNDLIIGYNPCVNAEAALFLAKKYGKKYMTYLVACVWDSLWNHSFLGMLSAPLRYISVRYVTRNSDYTLYVTNEFLQNRYPTDGLSLGCSDVYVSVNESVGLKRLERLKNRDLSETINIATTAAVYVRYKGQRFVIKALGRLKKKNKTNYHYYLIGGGDSSQLKRLATRCGVIDQVTFLGLLPHDKVVEVLDDMDVYMQPSLQEGLPRSVVEAMSRGLLCIGARTGAIPELIKNEYIVRRRSVSQIVDKLETLDLEAMKRESIRNIDEAKSYDNTQLELKRNAFFDLISEDMGKF